MNIHTDKTQENKTPLRIHADSRKYGGASTFQFVDNRSETIVQRKLHDILNSSLKITNAAQLKSNPESTNENVVQKQGKSTQSVQMEAMSSGTVIQRALRGTHDSLVAIEPEKGFRFGKTHGTWTDLLQAVAKYELLEARPSPTGNINKHKKFAKELFEGLDKIEEYATKWIKIHEASLLAEQGVNETIDTGDLTNVTPVAQSDLAQLSAARNLLRHVAWERSEITQLNPKTPVLSDDKMTAPAVDNAVGGQASRLDEIHHGGKGYYQPDALTADVTSNASAAIGIPGFDPNWAGRSMAAARIDKLLTARFETVSGQIENTSLVKMNFATHTRIPQGQPNAVATTGVYLEEAVGSEMRSGVLDQNHAIRREADRNPGNTNQIAMDDPVLQRSLNRLQLLDAICGQVDRHMGNLFIDKDPTGKVTGVQGIDNDMAFGSKMEGDVLGMRAPIDKGVSADLIGGGRAWRGMPPIADEQIALAILSIRPEDIESAITGLITPDEVAATIMRLTKTQNFIKTLPQNLLIAPGEWDTRRQELGNKQQAFNSYLGTARTEGLGIMVTASATVKTQLTQAMEAQKATLATQRRQGAVPEWIFAESQILSDVQNLIGRGVTEAIALQRGAALAARYASLVQFPANIDRTAMTYKAAMASMDASACATALESARRTMYALWG